jgi:hypothetical protein
MKNARTIRLKLNNYNYDDKYLDMIRYYLKTGILPDNLSDYQKNHIKEQYNRFGLKEGRIIYLPLDLEVVYKDDVPGVLKELYNDPQYGIGVGIKSFYDKVTSMFLGIKREDVAEFLKTQAPYQLTKAPKHNINRPIIGEYPNHRWAADLVDVKVYKGYNNQKTFILTVIDYFSKKVFARGLIDSKANTVAKAFEDICQNENDGTYPKILQTDNGSEFKAETKAWCQIHDIKLVNTLSYSPTSNGLIENFNNILRKMMREGFIRYKSLNWTDHLQDYIANRNNSKHSVTKQTPKTLWEPGQQKLKELDSHQMKNIDDKLIYSDIDQLRVQAKRKLEAKAARDVARFQVEEYKKGDSVRVLNSSLYSKVRKHIKAGNEKLVPVKYSPTIYEIDKIIIPIPGKEEFMNDRYTLIDPDTGEPVLQELKKNNPNADRVPKLFFASELQRVDKNTEQVLTRAQANKLNKVVDQLDIDDAKAKAKEKRKIRKEQGPTEQQIANQQNIQDSVDQTLREVRSRSRKAPAYLTNYHTGPIEGEEEEEEPTRKRKTGKRK